MAVGLGRLATILGLRGHGGQSLRQRYHLIRFRCCGSIASSPFSIACLILFRRSLPASAFSQDLRSSRRASLFGEHMRNCETGHWYFSKYSTSPRRKRSHLSQFRPQERVGNWSSSHAQESYSSFPLPTAEWTVAKEHTTNSSEPGLGLSKPSARRKARRRFARTLVRLPAVLAEAGARSSHLRDERLGSGGYTDRRRGQRKPRGSRASTTANRALPESETQEPCASHKPNPTES